MYIQHMVESVANNSVNLSIHRQYKPWMIEEHILGLANGYGNIFEVVERLGRRSLLDFGAGIGVGKLKYDEQKRPFDFEMCDVSTIKWRGNDEDILFNRVRNALGYNCHKCNSILEPEFELEGDKTPRYDCVVFHRFPPLSEGELTGAQVKERLSPYVSDDCIFLYSNLPIFYHDKFPFFKINPYEVVVSDSLAEYLIVAAF